MFDTQLSMRGKIWFRVFADFCGINIPTVADSKLPMWYHWAQRWGEAHSTLLYKFFTLLPFKRGSLMPFYLSLGRTSWLASNEQNMAELMGYIY